MPRLTDYHRNAMVRTLSRLHENHIKDERARRLILDTSTEYLPPKIRNFVKAGFGAHMTREYASFRNVTSAPVYSGADVEKMQADKVLRRKLSRLKPSPGNSFAVRMALRSRLDGFNTTKQLLDTYPELQPLVLRVVHFGAEPDLTKLRRALLKAGWPLRNKNA